jgi:hypothetical protein
MLEPNKVMEVFSFPLLWTHSHLENFINLFEVFFVSRRNILIKDTMDGDDLFAQSRDEYSEANWLL